MKDILVHYSFYYEDINDPDYPVQNINVKTALVYAENEKEAVKHLVEYFGESSISIIKSEVVVS